MNVIKCENGHHFDGDKYEVCPICGGKSASLDVATTYEEEKPNRIKGLFSRKKENQESIIDEKTTGQFIDSPSKAVLVNEDVEIEDDLDPEFPKEGKSEIPQNKGTENLSESIEKVKSNDEKTMGFFSSGSKNSNPENSQIKHDVDFPVGWLVCVKGNNLGKTFPISAGQNTIGRNSKYTIALEGDSYVSASNIHAKLIYEPNERQFMLMNGDSSSLTYLNGNAVYVPARLELFDKISFGNIKGNEYVFVPLCGENFSWTDYVED